MAHLIDIALVSLAIGVSGLAVVKYFLGLVHAPEGQPVSCSGCKASCHAGVVDDLQAIKVKKFKTV